MSAQEHPWERQADRILGIAASAILMAMMCLTFADVVARYVFNRPIRGGFEVTELLLLVLIFAGLPLVSHADEHVTMDFIDRLLRGRARAWLSRSVDLLVAALMFFMAWQVTLTLRNCRALATKTKSPIYCKWWGLKTFLPG